MERSEEIKRELKGLSIRWKLLILLGGSMLWLGLSLIIFGSVFLLVRLPMPGIARFTLFLIGVAATLLLFWRWIIRKVLADTSPLNMARRIERIYPNSNAAVITALQLGDSPEVERLGYLREFLDETIRQAAEFMRGIDLRRIYLDELRSIRRSTPILLIGAVLFSLSLLLSSDSLGLIFELFQGRAESPIRILSPKIVEVSPGNYQVRSGQSIKVMARVVDNIRDHPVMLFYRLEGGGWHQAIMTKEEAEIYGMKLENLARSIEYYVSVSGSESPRYRISVIREPMLSRFRYEIVYPAYTGLSPQMLEPNSGDIKTLIGSIAKLTAESTKPLQRASIQFKSGRKVELKITDGTSLSGQFRLEKEDRYHFELLDTEGISNSNPVRYMVTPVGDEPPKLQFISPEREVILDESMLLPIQVAAEDDFGIASLSLVYRIKGGEEEKRIELRRFDKPITAINFDYTWDLSNLNLLPEDEVHYFVEARDANDLTGPGIGRTEVYIARMPSVEDLLAGFEEKQRKGEETLREMARRGAEIQDVVDKIIEKLKRGEPLSWAERKELEQVIQTQRELDAQRRKMADTLRQLTGEIEKNDLFSIEMVQKIQEMQKLFEQVASDELKEAMRKLSQALEKLSQTDLLKNLQSARLNQEEFLKRIEQMIEQLKRLAVQQQIEKAARIAKEIDETQRKIISALEEMLNRDRVERTRELATQEENLSQKLGSLRKQLDRSVEETKKRNAYQELIPYMQKIGEGVSSESLKDDLSSAARYLRSSKPQGALVPAGRAMKELSEIRSALENLLETMRGQDASELVNAIDSAVEEGLVLLERHSSLTKRMERLIRSGFISDEIQEEFRTLTPEQQVISEGVGAIAERLSEIGRKQMGLDAQIIWQMESAQDGMRRSIRAIEDGRPNLALPISREAQNELSSTILKLLQTLDKINQQMTAAGLERMFEQLQQLAQEQARLNEMAQNLYNRIRQRGMTPTLERLLKQMALEQQMIREALERLADRMDKLSQVLGSLKDVAKEMRDVEGNLRRKRLNQETLRKQKEILTRMLESEKSLQKQDEKSRKREATTAKRIFTPSKAKGINPDLLKVRKELQKGLQSAFDAPIPEGYRDLVRRYYELLSESVR
ncbi:hypothetical protein J7M22_15455 [Candidatus Poribacteria bacterium]|nr:hypothetical protein [Candidatus Poribacteria bacterium]